jgi:cyanophycinase-like exopeptidase
MRKPRPGSWYYPLRQRRTGNLVQPYLRKIARAAGAGPVHMIDPRTDESADLEAAERVDAVWFTGGDQALIVSCLTTKDNGTVRC